MGIVHFQKNKIRTGGVIISTTRIIPIHKNKGKSIQQTLFDTTSYAMNPDKTEDKQLVSSYCCDPETVDSEFALSKREYFELTGRSYKNDIIAYQLRQSFKPGEVTPEEANAISYELASRLLKGKHAFIVATHVDKHHIHSHIIFNSTSLDCTEKFRNHFNSYRTVRELADYICAEHNLSVIQNPGPASPSYNEWDGCKKRISNRDILKTVIDEIITGNKPKSFEELLEQLSKKGYEIKREKHVSVKGFGQKKFIRLSSLGDDYTEEKLAVSLADSNFKVGYNKERPSLLIDIQKAMSDGKGIGYQNWAKSFNLKQMAKTFAFLQQNNLLSFESLEKTISEEKNKLDSLNELVDSSQKRLDEIRTLSKHIRNYSDNNLIYQEYKKLKKSPEYKKQHEEELQKYMDAKHYFDSLNLETKLPTLKELNIEFREVLAVKRAAINELYPLKKEYRNHLVYLENARVLLDIDRQKSDRTRLR